jgi:AcrR family transcriptional regulator
MPEPRVNARPKRKRDAATTREEILEAATRRFATQGYERAGVREIAADAGVTAALVNRYFGSKEGLFAEVITRALDMAHLLRDGRADLADHLARAVSIEGAAEMPRIDSRSRPSLPRRCSRSPRE